MIFAMFFFLVPCSRHGLVHSRSYYGVSRLPMLIFGQSYWRWVPYRFHDRIRSKHWKYKLFVFDIFFFDQLCSISIYCCPLFCNGSATWRQHSDGSFSPTENIIMKMNDVDSSSSSILSLIFLESKHNQT